MSASRALTGRELIAGLGRLGFQALRVEGSHYYLRHEDGRSTVVPVHAGETIRGLPFSSWARPMVRSVDRGEHFWSDGQLEKVDVDTDGAARPDRTDYAQ
jgi:predicted RNA binding protein YcfA (HicA-like mRNA interferase family)